MLKSLNDTHGIMGWMQVSTAGGLGYKRTTSSGLCVPTGVHARSQGDEWGAGALELPGADVGLGF